MLELLIIFICRWYNVYVPLQCPSQSSAYNRSSNNIFLDSTESPFTVILLSDLIRNSTLQMDFLFSHSCVLFLFNKRGSDLGNIVLLFMLRSNILVGSWKNGRKPGPGGQLQVSYYSILAPPMGNTIYYFTFVK